MSWVFSSKLEVLKIIRSGTLCRKSSNQPIEARTVGPLAGNIEKPFPGVKPTLEATSNGKSNVVTLNNHFSLKDNLPCSIIGIVDPTGRSRKEILLLSSVTELLSLFQEKVGAL